MFIAEVVQNPENEMGFTLRFPELNPDRETALRVQLVDADKFFMPSFSGFCVLPMNSQGEFGFTLLQLLEQCKATNLNSRVMEFVLIHGDQEEFVTCGEGFKDITINTNVVSCRLCLGKGKNLVLRMDWKFPTLEGKFYEEDGKLRVEIAGAPKGEPVLRRRAEYDIVFFDKEIRCGTGTENRYEIDYDAVIGQIDGEKGLYSLYYKAAPTDSAPAYYYRVVNDEDAIKQMHRSYEIMACRTKDKSASISVYRKWAKVIVSGVSCTATEAIFEIRNVPAANIMLQRVVSLAQEGAAVPYAFVSDDMEAAGGQKLSLLRWDHIHSREPLVYRVFAAAKGKRWWAVAEQPFEVTASVAHQDITIRGDNKGIIVKIVERPIKIRLGILGTCMTRWAFSRKYTDAYRDLYDVVFAHFWPSVFSLTDEAEDYPQERYADYNETEAKFVRREYEKTSLPELHDSNCDYVLIDFFVDAIHGPRRMKNGKFIGYKGYAKDFYQDHLMFDTEKYFMNDQDYLERWKKHADRLIEDLRVHMPERRIILAVGGLTHSFLSEDGQVKCFDGMVLRSSYMTKHSINALNHLWDQMNAYFISKLPGAHVLNLREYGFLAHDKNPANVRPYHFINGYYRAMSAEVSRIILWDRQNR